MSSRNPQRVREQADILLNNIETITADARVSSMFLSHQKKLSVEARVQKAVELLKGCLTRIQASKDPQAAKDKAASLLKNIRVITVDARVDRMFRMQEHKLTIEARMSQDLLRYLVVDNTPTSSSIIKDLINKETLKPVCKNNKASQFGARRY